MKMTLSTNQAADLLKADENANWSYNGAKALIQYLEELDEGAEEERELDIVAIRCEFSEYKSLYNWADEYFGGDSWMEEFGIGYAEDDEDRQDIAIRNHLNENTSVIEFEGGIIIQDF